MCKTTLLLDNAIRTDIVSARGILTDLHNEKAKFELDLIDVNSTLVNTLLSVEHVINTLPVSISDDITNSIHTEMDDTIQQYNEILHKSEYMLHLTGTSLHFLYSSNNNVLNIIRFGWYEQNFYAKSGRTIINIE